MNDSRSFQGEPDDGQTPLDPNESTGLIPAWITTRGDLNEAEAANIRKSVTWTRRQLKIGAPVASDAFLRGLHKAMFGQVWRWAGRYRSSERNIGVAPYQIGTLLRQLFDDVAAWQESDSYPLEEQAVRLHHRLTWIHPFPNGNGRVARVLVDCFLHQFDTEAFTWGRGLSASEARPRYIAAIRKADAGDITELLAFVRN